MAGKTTCHRGSSPTCLSCPRQQFPGSRRAGGNGDAVGPRAPALGKGSDRGDRRGSSQRRPHTCHPHFTGPSCGHTTMNETHRICSWGASSRMKDACHSSNSRKSLPRSQGNSTGSSGTSDSIMPTWLTSSTLAAPSRWCQLSRA